MWVFTGTVHYGRAFNNSVLIFQFCYLRKSEPVHNGNDWYVLWKIIPKEKNLKKMKVSKG